MIKKENLKDLYPLSPMQEGMLYHSLLDPDDTTYHQQVIYTLAGEINPEVMEQAWRDLFSRHDILRTVFISEKVKRPLQVVLHHSQDSFSYKDLTLEQEESTEAAIETALAIEQELGFNLQAGPLMRLILLKNCARKYTLIWSHHHLLMDGWSVGILLHDFITLYEGHNTGTFAVLPKPQPFSQYIKWLEHNDSEQAKDYWRAALQSQKHLCQFPPLSTSHHSDNPQDSIKAELIRELPAALCDQLYQNAKQWKVTIGNLLQACWAMLLSKYNDQEDIVFGTLVSGRPGDLSGALEMIGLFINTIPLTVTIDGQDTLLSIAKRIQDQLLDSEAHQHLSLSDIQQCSTLGKDLIKHIFAFENFPAPEGNASFEVSSTRKLEKIPYDLGLMIVPNASSQETSQLQLHLLYDQAIYPLQFMNQLSDHFTSLLATGIQGELVKDIKTVVSADTKVSSGHEVFAPDCQSYIELFHRSAAAFPEHTAIIEQQEQISYSKLNSAANRLATVFEGEFHVQDGDHIALVFPQGIPLLACLLAIGKLGAVFVPLDPSHLAQRLTNSITKAQCKLVLTTSAIEQQLRNSINCATLIVDDISTELEANVTDRVDATPKRLTEPNIDDLAYIIFTSGSTGEPKGVMVKHRGLINLLLWSQREFGIGNNSRVSAIASPAFDASIWEVLPALCTGATVHVIPDSIAKDTQEITAYLQEHRINVSFLPPAICEDACLNYAYRLEDTTILTGGDVLNSVKDSACRVYNNYGPTEFSVVATCKLISTNEPAPYSIGKAIDHCEVLVLNRQRQLCPTGVAGEIALSGEGLAKGYWDDKEASDKYFIPHPSKPKEKAYLTGDRGKWREDGDLDFLGRVDHQISLRGHRIEPMEIEKQLTSHPSISHAAVCLSTHPENSGKVLVAFYVTSTGDQPLGAELRQWLSSCLPHYMIPGNFVPLESLPLNGNGKIDRHTLAKLPTQNTETTHFSQPKSSTEIQVSEIWQQVLELDRVGIYDNFLEIGGHSLAATRVISQLKGSYSFDIPMSLLFETPILKDFSAHIDVLKNTQQESKETEPNAKTNKIGRINRSKYVVNT